MAEDDDAVGDGEGLRHDVGDEDDADAAAAHAVDGLEAAAGLLDAERGEGLVEDDEPAAPVDEAVELDRLALAAGEVLDAGAEPRDAGAAGLERAAGLGLHGAVAEEGDAEDAAGELAAHEEVRDHVEVGAEREVLVDRLDAGGLGVGLGGEGALGAVEDDAPGARALLAGDDLDQRRLAGAVVAEERHHLAGGDR